MVAAADAAAATAEALVKAWRSEPPELWMQRLTIESTGNRKQALCPLLFEQLKFIRALRDHNAVVAVKPRQPGFTTAATLFLFAKAYRADHPRRVLQAAHDDRALRKVRRMVEVAHEELPKAFRFPLRTSNLDVTEFGHNRAQFLRILGGDGGQGRGDTYNDFHATEMAFWRARVSSKHDADTDADSDLYASVLAGMHDPTGHVIVESTGDGPRGHFHKLVTDAMAGRGPNFGVFLPWSAVSRYVAPVPTGFEPTPDEETLIKLYGLTPAQLMWRRNRLTQMGGDLVRFRREYPLTQLEPFLFKGTGWFDQEKLSVAATLARIRDSETNGRHVVWEAPQPGREYFIGLDTAGGVRGDEAVAHIIGDDRQNAAMWASNETDPYATADVAIELARRHNNAIVLCEQNHFGRIVNERLMAAGVRVFFTPEGKLWYSNRARKLELLTYARHVVDEFIAAPLDHATIVQMQSMVEDKYERILARDDGHDDRAMAWCFAQWAARLYTRPREVDVLATRHRDMEQAMARFAREFNLNLRS